MTDLLLSLYARAREVPWGIIIVALVVLGIIVSGFWAGYEIWSRANDGVYGG